MDNMEIAVGLLKLAMEVMSFDYGVSSRSKLYIVTGDNLVVGTGSNTRNPNPTKTFKLPKGTVFILDVANDGTKWVVYDLYEKSQGRYYSKSRAKVVSSRSNSYKPLNKTVDMYFEENKGEV